MLEKYEIVQGMFYGFDYMRIFSASPKEKLTIVREGEDFILSQGRTKDERTQEKTLHPAHNRAFQSLHPISPTSECRPDKG
ncbi:type I restriction enzyme endonuclease domain-containing protein [Methanosarcina sp.]|uniref:type I restriction enzyme endonuclease domain-containing protein n=1 Tax=Methanosarcina sp. TaxID=2213 RepID=UPI003A0FB8FF